MDTLKTKVEIARAFWALTYVTAVLGAQVLRLVKAGDVGEDPNVVRWYLRWACRAGLDAPVIRGLAEKIPGLTTGFALCNPAVDAAFGGHTDVIQLLHSMYGRSAIYIDVQTMVAAAAWGHNAMIDYLVEEYGVDPKWVGGEGWTALHDAAGCGRVRTVKHLVEKYSVDIQEKDGWGKTALDWAEREGRTECAAVLRGYGAVNGQFLDTDSDSSW